MESLSKSAVENKYFDACCCCLQKDCFRDISTEYYSSGHKEVYGDLLKNTFNIQIAGHEDITNSRLICNPCVSRLRDAATFKQMVLDSQEVYHRYWVTKNGDEEAVPYADILTDIKVEALPLTDADSDSNALDNYCSDSNETLAELKHQLGRNEVEEEVAQPYNCMINKTEDMSKTESTQKEWSKIIERRGVGPLLRQNSLQLLAHSTGCVFQWNKSRYRCFCCEEPFSDLSSLRHHTETNHTLEHIERKIINQQNRLVKVEISTLNCKLCAQKTENLSDLREHLTEKHNIEFVQTEKDCLLVPFKINGQLQCQICNEQFTLFRLLNIHVNKHFQKHVCHICGSGYSNSVFLNQHKTRSHRPFRCKECDLVFKNKSDKKTHDITVHDAKFERKLRFPCPYCPQRFLQENFRVEHLVEKHGMTKPEHKCNVCSKVFITKSLCNNHFKTVHMKEKKQECDICHKRFYNKSDVIRHIVTHTGEKKFSCAICNSPFAAKDSLNRHVKRTHGGVQ